MEKNMSNKAIISTSKAPAAIGPYSQAVKVGSTVYLSGQIPLDPHSMQLVEGDIEAQTTQVFNNLAAVAEAAGGALNDAVKVNISLTNLNDFGRVNEVMKQFFREPYPARACVQVAALPRGAAVEIELILEL
jgi:reactive intermediate/imine deaminase